MSGQHEPGARDSYETRQPMTPSRHTTAELSAGMGPTSAHPCHTVQNYPLGTVTYLFVAAEKGDITTIIGGIAPDWGPFGSLGNEARVMIEVVMAIAILLCLGIAIWGAAKQRIGATALRDTFSAEQGKGLIVAGLTGVFIIGSLGTLFTIVYGMAV